MQKFINIAPWDHGDVQAEVQAVFAEELVPTAAGSPIGVVGIVDESGFTKKGDHSAGVARQHNGRLGKEDNCQVGVFLVGVTPGGSALLDHGLYLPEETWCEDTQECRDRRDKVHIPERVGLPDQAPDRRGADPADGGAGRRGPGLDHRRRRVRPQRRIPRRTGDAGTSLRGRGPGQHDGLDRGPGHMRPAPGRSGPGADAAEPRVGAERGRGGIGTAGRELADLAGPSGGQRAALLRVRRSAGLGGASRRRWPADLVAGTAEFGGDARDQVLRQQRRRRDAAGGAGARSPARGTRSRSISRTPRATWAWRSTRRGRGSAGTIT